MKKQQNRDSRDSRGDMPRPATPAPDPTGGSPVEHTGDRDYLAHKRAVEEEPEAQRR